MFLIVQKNPSGLFALVLKIRVLQVNAGRAKLPVHVSVQLRIDLKERVKVRDRVYYIISQADPIFSTDRRPNGVVRRSVIERPQRPLFTRSGDAEKVREQGSLARSV